MLKAVIRRCLCQAVATPMRVPCPRHDFALLVPCLCLAIVMCLQCRCHSFCNVVAKLLTCHGHAIAMPFTMIVPWFCHVLAMFLPRW